MRWIWIDRFVEFEPRTRATAIKNLTRSEEHLHDQYPSYPLMPASLMIEGMAQTAGILVGQAREFRERVILAKVQKAGFQGLAGPGDQLTYQATLEHLDDAGASTSGRVLKNGQPFGEVHLMFSHLDREAGARVGIPEHNFVFGDEFKRLLANYDLDLSHYPGN